MLLPSPLPPLRLSTPPLSVRVDAEVTLSTVARLVASGAAVSKADLVPAAGMARTTVSAAVDELLARGVLRLAGTRPTVGRGRPAERLALSPRGGHVLLADVGARGAHLAVVDLSQQVWRTRTSTSTSATDRSRCWPTWRHELDALRGRGRSTCRYARW